MKKIILSLILALIVIFSCVSPAFAEESDAWVLHENAKYITHSGEKYLPIFDIRAADYNYFGYRIETVGYNNIRSQFDSPSTESMFYGTQVIAYASNKDCVIEVHLPAHGLVLFVAESYMDKFNQLCNGNAESYKLENEYKIESALNKEDFLNALSSTVTLDKISSTYFEWVDLYSCDYENEISVISGAVLKRKSTGDMYILRYSDYDSSYFYADGRFARLDNGKEYTVYEITDETVKAKINSLIDERPDDELEWIVGTEPSKTQQIISSVFFFGALPLAIIVFCVIMLIKSKKKFYRVPLITLIASAAILMIAAAIVYF